VPPVSLLLATDARAYVGGLTDYRSGLLDDWTGIFAAATKTAATEARTFADRVAALQGRWRVQAEQPRASSSADKLITLLPAYPIVDLNLARELLHVSAPAAWGALRAYEAVGLFEVVDRFERELATPRGRHDPPGPRPTLRADGSSAG
jgi:hypothetical protein